MTLCHINIICVTPLEIKFLRQWFYVSWECVKENNLRVGVLCNSKFNKG